MSGSRCSPARRSLEAGTLATEPGRTAQPAGQPGGCDSAARAPGRQDGGTGGTEQLLFLFFFQLLEFHRHSSLHPGFKARMLLQKL